MITAPLLNLAQSLFFFPPAEIGKNWNFPVVPLAQQWQNCMWGLKYVHLCFAFHFKIFFGFALSKIVSPFLSPFLLHQNAPQTHSIPCLSCIFPVPHPPFQVPNWAVCVVSGALFLHIVPRQNKTWGNALWEIWRKRVLTSWTSQAR